MRRGLAGKQAGSLVHGIEGASKTAQPDMTFRCRHGTTCTKGGTVSCTSGEPHRAELWSEGRNDDVLQRCRVLAQQLQRVLETNPDAPGKRSDTSRWRCGVTTSVLTLAVVKEDSRPS